MRLLGKAKRIHALESQLLTEQMQNRVREDVLEIRICALEDENVHLKSKIKNHDLQY